MSTDIRYDVAIVGGGPAGLNAALVLGRCRRAVLLCDAGRPRNAYSHGVNGFLTRSGTNIWEMRDLARRELAQYPGVEIRDVEVVDAERGETGFVLTLADGTQAGAKKLLLATGVNNDLPDIEGFRELWGQGVHNCPYCDGWEHRDEPIAVYAPGGGAKGLALEMLSWSRDIALLTDGPCELSEEERAKVERNGIQIVEGSIRRLEGAEGRLARIHLEDGRALEKTALFFVQGECQVSPLAVKLGCELNRRGTVDTSSYEKTDVPGLYVAGDASRRVQFAIVAAAEGAMAAFAINNELAEEQLR